jgi:sigma-B regulation protein RsbU (phosphoserine phosphatase)
VRAPILLALPRENHSIQSLDDAASLPLGIVAGERYTQSTVQLHSGDVLLLYTDGITEAASPQRTPTRHFFGVERLDQQLLNMGVRYGMSAQECLAQIQAAVKEFTENAPPKDDQTLIAIRCV